MEQDLQQQLATKFAALPSDVQQAIQSADLSQKIQSVGAAFQLHLDQVGGLEDEVMLVMLGVADPSEFPKNLAEQIHIPQEEAEKIAAEVGEKIFLPIRESMKRFVGERTHPQTAPAPAPAPAPAQPKPVYPADIILTQKTISTPEAATPLPTPPAQEPPKPASATVPTPTSTPSPATSANQPTQVAQPKPTQPQPTSSEAYKADPYREPIE